MNKLKITDVRVHPGDSAFLIDDGNTSIMYDSGFGFTGYKVADKIKNILGNRKLDYIFLTHSHYDHALGSAYALKYWPDAKVTAGEYAAKIFAKSSAKAVMRDLDNKLAKKCNVGIYEDLADNLKVDIVLSDGDVIKAGDMEFTAINLPGHTRCSIAYYCGDKKLLLGSETIGVFNAKDDVIPSYLVGYKMTLDSIEKVEKLDIENILVPHYGVLDKEKTQFYLKRAKESAKETADEIIEMIKNKKTKGQIISFLKDKFHHGYTKKIYPDDALELNTSIMIDLLKKEFALSD